MNYDYVGTVGLYRHQHKGQYVFIGMDFSSVYLVISPHYVFFPLTLKIVPSLMRENRSLI